MKQIKPILVSFGEKVFSPECFGWIDSDKIFFLRSKFIHFYHKTKGKCLPEKFFCFKKIKITSKILGFRLNFKEKLLLAATLDGALFLRSFFSSKKSRVFFSNSHFLKFEKDPFRSGVFYSINKKDKEEKNSIFIDSLYSLCIFNINEKKTVQIYKYQTTMSPQISLFFSKKKVLLFTSDINVFLFFFFDWDAKKLSLKKIFHDSEILSFLLFDKYILASDRGGNFILFEQLLQKGLKLEKKSTVFLQKKTKLFHFRFSFLTILGNFFFLINHKEENYVIHLDFEKILKKKISIFPNKEILMSVKKNPITNDLLGITRFNEIFFLKFFKKLGLQLTRKLETPLVLMKKNYNEIFSISPIKIFHLSFVEGETFLIFGLGNFFDLLDLKKMDLINSYRNIGKNFKTFSKNYPTNHMNYNFSFKSILFLYRGFFFKMKLTPKNLSSCNLSDWENKIKKQKKDNCIENNTQIFSFLKNGKIICLKISEFALKIYDHSYSSGNWKDRKENFFFRRKCSSVDFSKDGFFLLTSCTSFLTLWKICPKIMKIKTAPLNVEGRITQIKFLSDSNQELILISSTTEVTIWDFKANQIKFNTKLQIFGLETDDNNKKLLISTQYFRVSTLHSIPAMVIFNFNMGIPVAVFSSEIFSTRCILGLNFYKQKKKKRENGKLILLDNFLEIYKIVF